MAEIIPGGEDDNRSNLSLPVSNSELGRFLGGLLGQPQSLERSFDGYYDIDFQDILNLHEVIDQRITKQNSAHLCYFRAVIYFSDKSKRILPSLEEFISYREILKKNTVQIRLEWSYLINFPSNDLPERQQISIGFRKQDSDVGIKFSSEKPDSNVVDIRVDYTERTWSHDIEKILSDEIGKLRRSDVDKKKIDMVGEVVHWVFVISGFVMIYFVYISMVNEYESKVNLYIQGLQSKRVENLNDLGVKLDEVIRYIIDPLFSSPSILIVFFIGIFLIAFVASIFSRFSKMELKSFITITEEDANYRSRVINNESKHFFKTVASGALAVSTSVIGSFFWWVIGFD